MTQKLKHAGVVKAFVVKHVRTTAEGGGRNKHRIRVA